MEYFERQEAARQAEKEREDQDRDNLSAFLLGMAQFAQGKAIIRCEPRDGGSDFRFVAV